MAQIILTIIISQALKTLCIGKCTCIACVNWPLPLCHEPLDEPSEKAQKEPHGSFEVICSSSEHDIYRVSEKTLVEVPSQTMVALASTTVLSLIPVILLLLPVLHGNIDADAFLEDKLHALLSDTVTEMYKLG